MYQVTEALDGYTTYDSALIFEGCSQSPTYGTAWVEPGPHDLVAIYTGDRMSVRWRGTELGVARDVAIVRFAPN